MANRGIKTALVAAIIAYALIRAWAFIGSDNGIDQHHNAYDRGLFVVHQWLPDPRPMPDEVYPPAHFYLIAGALAMWGDLSLSPRLVSLLFALATLLPFWVLARYAVGRNAAVFAIALLAVYPLHVRLSVVSLDSAPFLFFALSGLALAVKGRQAKRGKGALYAASGLALTLAALTRFEGWLLLPLAPLMTGRKDAKHLAAVWACGAVGPLLYMLDAFRLYHDPLYFLKAAASISSHHLRGVPLFTRAMGWPGVLLSTTSAPILLAAALGLFLSRGDGRPLWPAALAGILFVVFEARTLMGSFAYNETKYVALLVLPVLPYGGLAIERLGAMRLGRAANLGIAGALLIICGVGIWQVNLETQRFRAPAELEGLARWLEVNVKPGEAVLMGVRDQGYILARSGLPYQSFLLTGFDEKTGAMDGEAFDSSLRDPRARYLLYPFYGDGLDFAELLGFSPGTLRAKAKGRTFLLRTRMGHWNVYEILPRPNPIPFI